VKAATDKCLKFGDFYVILRHLFFIDLGSAPRIVSASLAGRNQRAIVTNNLDRPAALAIDYESARLFWSDMRL
jgi:Low-density lipoprotein receptor repeat class B